MPWARLFSWLWPVRVARAEGRHGTLDLVWEYGRLVVNSPHANQSHGALHQVWQRTFREAGVPARSPRSVLLLGLGAGSVVHILRHELGLDAPITAVEDDPVMLDWGRTRFGLDRIADLQVVLADARAILPRLDGPFDLVVVDLFEDLDLANGTEAPDFVRDVLQQVAPGGLLCWNTIARDRDQRTRVRRLETHLQERSGPVQALELGAINRVLVAGPPTA